MSLIVYTSPTNAPGTLDPPVPRYEIGKFFVTIYHADRRTRRNDQGDAFDLTTILEGCLGKGRPMFTNQYHPSLPEEMTKDSVYKGTTEEVHDGVRPRLAHYHVELIGTQRNAGFTAEEIEVLKHKLDTYKWG